MRCWRCRASEADAASGVCARCRPLRRFKSVRWLSTVTAGLLVLCAVLSWRRLLAAREKLAYLAQSHDIDPSGMTVEQWRTAERALLPEDTRMAGLMENATGPWVVVGTLTAGFFLLWFRRARSNARLLAGADPSVRRGFAYAGWLLPVANLVVPRRTLAELRPPGTTGGRVVLHVWWLLWIATVTVSAFAFWLWWEAAPEAGGRLAQGKVPAAAPLENAVRVLTVADGLLIACALATVALLWRTTQLQEKALAGGPPPGPRPLAVAELDHDQLLGRVVARWGAETDGAPRPRASDSAEPDHAPPGRDPVAGEAPPQRTDVPQPRKGPSRGHPAGPASGGDRFRSAGGVGRAARRGRPPHRGHGRGQDG
ncbi:DUF4328 domain-containing protein [Streptomyces bohaiensis]|uniref:DUF4328 domain-containing protein n=1 Tax=Streptomyces bohaiensis TaxID=1431344 RepID=UPI003B787269